MAIQNPLSMELLTTKTLTWFLIIALALAATNTYSTDGKRFDCQMFCRKTGFHGMIGGCRCSFTLFSSKRSLNSYSSDPHTFGNSVSRRDVLAVDSRLLQRGLSTETKATNKLNRFAHRPRLVNFHDQGRP